MPNHYTTIAICTPGYEFSVKDFNERHRETCLCSVVRPMPEAVQQIPSVSYQDGTTEKQRLGVAQDWYEWANENWGTKWGTYDAEAIELGGDSAPILIKFQSAWCAPKILDLIADWLKRTCGFKQVSFIGFNPYDDSLAVMFHDHILKETPNGNSNSTQTISSHAQD